MDENNLELQTTPVVEQKIKLWKKKNFKITVGIVLILFIGVVSYFNYFTPEAQAKRCVNNYLSAIKNGEDTSKYKQYNNYIPVNDFINVLDYKYLNVLKSETTIGMMGISKENWENEINSDIPTKSFEELVQFTKNEYSKVTTGTNFITIHNMEYKKIDILYDVSCTNAIGTQVFKKVKFNVNNNNLKRDYRIISID